MQSIFCRPLRFVLLALVSGSNFSAHIAHAQTGPGGVGSADGSTALKLWYRVDNGVAVTGTAVDSWTNSAGVPALSISESGSQRPTLVTGAVNGYPEISFGGSNRLVTAIGAITTTNFVTNQATTFVVSRADNTTQTSSVYTTDPLGGDRFSNHIPWGGTVYYDIGTCCDDRIQAGGLTNLTSYSVWSYDAINTATGKQLYRNGALVQNVAVAALTYNSHATQRFNIGGNTSNGVPGFEGDITEVIIFRQKINTAQRRIIQNYLAAKYGITLGADDLYTMDEPGNGNYDHDVAGIGRVDASNLQNDSRGTGIVRVLNASGFDNGDYFFWGHNNGALTQQLIDLPTGVQSRLTRVWRGQEVGAITDLDIEFDLTSLAPVSASQLRLLVDTDNDGSFADETPISGAADQGNNVYRFADVTALTTASPTTRRFTLAFAGQAPGGVSGNLVWWLKADAGVLEVDATDAEDNDAVAQWMDYSSARNNASNATAVNRPVFKTNIINGNPALEFDGNRFLYASTTPGIGNTEDFIIFMVFKQSSFVSGGTNDGAGSYVIDRVSEPENLASFKIVNGDKYFYQRRQNDGSNLGGPVSSTSANTESFVTAAYYRDHQGTSATEGIYIDGALDVSQAGPTGSMSVPQIQIGRHAITANNGLNGYFAEIAVYDNSILSAGERNRIQSYLAIKYGITLDPSVDYVRSGGSTIYPSTSTHAGYVHDIAGIARDDNSGLYQPTSRSQNVGNMITVSNPSDLQNNRFLIWGHNNGDLSAPTNADVGGNIDLRLSRVWRVRETGGDVGTVSITVDMSWVPGPETASDLRLLVDSDGNFANATEYAVNSSSGDLYTFDNINLGNDNYFTIGTVDMFNTTLPVELTSFDIAYEAPVVVATWETASELNNDYFTLERAGEDLNFFEVLRQPGAGTSAVPRTYTAVDPHPFGGRSYYRLKQTDYDGTTAYSDIRRMDIDETGRELVLYPNPNNGREMEFSMGNTVFQLHEVEVINSQGVTLEKRRITQDNLRTYRIMLDKTLGPGLYLVRANYNGKTRAFRMVVP